MKNNIHVEDFDFKNDMLNVLWWYEENYADDKTQETSYPLKELEIFADANGYLSGNEAIFGFDNATGNINYVSDRKWDLSFENFCEIVGSHVIADFISWKINLVKL